MSDFWRRKKFLVLMRSSLLLMLTIHHGTAYADCTSLGSNALLICSNGPCRLSGAVRFEFGGEGECSYYPAGLYELPNDIESFLNALKEKGAQIEKGKNYELKLPWACLKALGMIAGPTENNRTAALNYCVKDTVISEASRSPEMWFQEWNHKIVAARHEPPWNSRSRGLPSAEGGNFLILLILVTEVLSELSRLFSRAVTTSFTLLSIFVSAAAALNWYVDMQEGHSLVVSALFAVLAYRIWRNRRSPGYKPA
jgi:hypothetical protein